MRELALYLQFLVALGAASMGLRIGSLPVLLPMGLGLPGGHVVQGEDLRQGLFFGTIGAILLFYAVARWKPLAASLARTALCGLAALPVALALLHFAARVDWLDGRDAVTGAAVTLATLGYLPFRFADRT